MAGTEMIAPFTQDSAARCALQVADALLLTAATSATPPRTSQPPTKMSVSATLTGTVNPASSTEVRAMISASTVQADPLGTASSAPSTLTGARFSTRSLRLTTGSSETALRARSTLVNVSATITGVERAAQSGTDHALQPAHQMPATPSPPVQLTVRPATHV